MALVYNGPGSSCTGEIAPGLLRLQELIHVNFPQIYAKGRVDDLYCCREVGETKCGSRSSSPSFHGVGRAIDVFPLVDKKGRLDVAATKAAGDPLAAWLINNASKLQVQEVIWQRKIWTAKSGVWKDYHGKDAHTAHLHISVNNLAWDETNVLTPPPPPPPPPYRDRQNMPVPAMNDGELYFFGTLINVAILGLAGYGAYQLIQGK